MSKLKAIRTSLKLTQSQLGKGIGISRSQIASIETGARNLTDRIQRDLSINFGVNQEWFKDETKEMFSDKYRDLKLTSEEREFTDLYESLDSDYQKLILDMMKTMASK